MILVEIMIFIADSDRKREAVEPGDDEKQTIVVTARVHPGETNSSWMMKGLLEFVTSSASQAQVRSVN